MKKKYHEIGYLIIIMFVLGFISLTLINGKVRTNECKREQDDLSKIVEFKSDFDEILYDNAIQEYILNVIGKRDYIVYLVGTNREISVDLMKKQNIEFYNMINQKFTKKYEFASQSCTSNRVSLYVYIYNDLGVKIKMMDEEGNVLIGKYSSVMFEK